MIRRSTVPRMPERSGIQRLAVPGQHPSDEGRIAPPAVVAQAFDDRSSSYSQWTIPPMATATAAAGRRDGHADDDRPDGCLGRRLMRPTRLPMASDERLR